MYSGVVPVTVTCILAPQVTGKLSIFSGATSRTEGTCSSIALASLLLLRTPSYWTRRFPLRTFLHTGHHEQQICPQGLKLLIDKPLGSLTHRTMAITEALPMMMPTS